MLGKQRQKTGLDLEELVDPWGRDTGEQTAYDIGKALAGVWGSTEAIC